MNGPFTALAWEYFRRAGRNFLLAAFWMTAGTLFFGYLFHRIGASEMLRERGILFILLMQVTVAVPLLAAAQVEQRGKDNPMMPARWYRLPVSTPWLVGVQMLFGTAAILLLCLLVNIAITGMVFGLWFPWQMPLFFVTALVVALAFAWGLGGFVLARLLAAGMAAALLVDFFFDLLRWLLQEPRPRQHPELTMLALIALALAGTLLGVLLDRRGVRWPGVRPAYDALTRRIAASRPAPRPFASPAEAQFWYEWHTRGMALPLVALLMGVVGIGLRAAAPGEHEVIYVVAALFTWCFTLISYFVGFVAAGAWRDGRVQLQLPSFVAARPLTTGELSAAVLRACTASVLASTGILAVCYLVALGPDGLRELYMTAGVARAGGLVHMVAIAGVVVLVAFGSWVMFMLGMTSAATGRRWVGGAVGGLLFLLPILMIIASQSPPFAGTRAGAVLEYGIIVCPTVLASVGCVALHLLARRLRLISARTVLASACGAVVACGALLTLLLPSNWPPIVAICFAVALAALVVKPFAGMPAALHWNRHR
jgi:hypothetical protein